MKVHFSLTTREPPCSRYKKTEPRMTLGIRDNNSILSIDLNQDEDEIIIERDSPGYSSFQCLSDIGTSLQWSIGPYTMACTRARGTDFVRLRPASASVRFLRNLLSCPVR